MRLYVDEEVEKEKDTPTPGFVECTDVFPIEDQIVDCAAGGFTAAVITDTGRCMMVGHDKYRSYYDHLPEV